MNRREKRLIINLVVVLVITIVFVTGMANIKNAMNRSEAIRAMEFIGREVLAYRKEHGSLPARSYVDNFADAIGAVRLGRFEYRAPWLEFGAEPNSTILAYAKKNYHGIISAGYVVLWLDGRVEWIEKDAFEQLLAHQQQQEEIEWLKEHLSGTAR